MRGSMNSVDVFGSNMQPSHPFSLVTPLKDNIDLVATLVHGKTADPTGAVKLIGGNVECTSCHNPHVQAKDQLSLNFLREGQFQRPALPGLPRSHPADERTGQSARRLVNQRACPVHRQDIAPGLARKLHYGGCRLPASPAMRRTTPCGTRACCAARMSRIASPATTASNISPMAPYANVFPEYAKPKIGHPFPTSTNPHDAAENTLLNNNRHATCVDCHNAHGLSRSGSISSSAADPHLAEGRRGHQCYRRNQRAHTRHQSI